MSQFSERAQTTCMQIVHDSASLGTVIEEIDPRPKGVYNPTAGEKPSDYALAHVNQLILELIVDILESKKRDAVAVP